MIVVETNCLGCGKAMRCSEELAGCLRCEDCPFPEEPCETCGKVEPEPGHDCCACNYCVIRRLRADNAKLIEALRPFAESFACATVSGDQLRASIGAYAVAARVLKEIEDVR